MCVKCVFHICALVVFWSLTEVLGRFRYLAPEYFMYGKVNNKIDVYAFGVVLLELITGRIPIDTARPKGQENLVIWVFTFFSPERSLSFSECIKRFEVQAYDSIVLQFLAMIDVLI